MYHRSLRLVYKKLHLLLLLKCLHIPKNIVYNMVPIQPMFLQLHLHLNLKTKGFLISYNCYFQLKSLYCNISKNV
nr:MAG TPA: hypothetical protein [Caudoviricetes sp.]